MNELTAGDERYIEEAAQRWASKFRMAAGEAEELPEAVEARIGEWEETYRKSLEEFCQAALREGSVISTDRLLDEFQEEWTGEHPEYDETAELFRECSEEDRAKIQKALTD